MSNVSNRIPTRQEELPTGLDIFLTKYAPVSSTFQKRSSSFDKLRETGDLGEEFGGVNAEMFYRYLQQIDLHTAWDYLMECQLNTRFADEMKSLRNYLTAQYDPINRLTSGRGLDEEGLFGYYQTFQNIVGMDSLFDHVPKTTRPFITFKCFRDRRDGTLPYPIEKQYKFFEFLKFGSFLSTTLSSNYIEHEAEAGDICTEGDTIVCIYVMPESRCLPIKSHHELHVDSGKVTEYEMLLDRFGVLKNASFTYTKDNGRRFPVYFYLPYDDGKRDEARQKWIMEEGKTMKPLGDPTLKEDFDLDLDPDVGGSRRSRTKKRKMARKKKKGNKRGRKTKVKKLFFKRK
jgi:hypothetical protein